MSTPLLATKLYIPPPRPKVVLRARLIERLNEGLHRKLTLISAPAGFGKTTLVSEWVADGQRPIAWLSLDERDNDPSRFLAYLIAALQTASPDGGLGEGVLSALQSPQPPAIEAILTRLLNEITTIPDSFTLVLDDYHVIDAQPIHNALTFLLEHLPPPMHLVIATREDPPLPLPRLRARGHLTELRVADLRFTLSEAAGFLNQVMALNLSAADITALETRTEGWIAGLQLAALALQGTLSMQGQGHEEASSFIQSFTGSHHFILDYLVEEVLQQQPDPIQTFLLHTSILDRLCGPLCDALLPQAEQSAHSPASGQETLAYLEQANLFIIPLDNERRWYRYHHLFADLLRQRLHQRIASTPGDEAVSVADLHSRASRWYEDRGLELEAFHHAAAANDIEHAARLMEGEGMPLHFRGAVMPVLNWLASLPTAVLDGRPSLWVMYASALSMAGQLTDVEPKLQAAEAALEGITPDAKTRNLIGHIAAIRALVAATHYQVETIIEQSRRALAYLHPDNLPVRTATTWKLGLAYYLQGDRAAASQAYREAISAAQATGNTMINISATTGLGGVQETENQLHLAAQTYQRVLKLAGDPPPLIVCEAHLGLARIFYEWNDLEAAHQHGQQSLQLARQIENNDRFIACELFLARLKLTQGDVTGAAALLAQASHAARQHNFTYRIPEVAAAQVLVLLHQGNLTAAAHLAQTHTLPLSQARVHLAQGDTAAALALLAPLRQQMAAKGWADEQLKVTILQAVAHDKHGETAEAIEVLGEALALAAPEGFIRLFVDEGPPMAQLLAQTAVSGLMPDYTSKLLAAFAAETQQPPAEAVPSPTPPQPPLIEPLSQRELEVLQLIAQGLSNREISQRLFLALNTVKGHNRKIYGKLQVQRRTEAVARARQLGLL